VTTDPVTNQTVEKFDGLCIKLLEYLATNLQFTYSLHLVADGLYGDMNPETSVWNGIIGELLDKV